MRAGQVVNLVDFCPERLSDVVPNELKVGFSKRSPMFFRLDVKKLSAYDVVLVNKLGMIAAEEASSPSDKDRRNFPPAPLRSWRS